MRTDKKEGAVTKIFHLYSALFFAAIMWKNVKKRIQAAVNENTRRLVFIQLKLYQGKGSFVYFIGQFIKTSQSRGAVRKAFQIIEIPHKS